MKTRAIQKRLNKRLAGTAETYDDAEFQGSRATLLWGAASPIQLCLLRQLIAQILAKGYSRRALGVLGVEREEDVPDLHSLSQQSAADYIVLAEKLLAVGGEIN